MCVEGDYRLGWGRTSCVDGDCRLGQGRSSCPGACGRREDVAGGIYPRDGGVYARGGAGASYVCRLGVGERHTSVRERQLRAWKAWRRGCSFQELRNLNPGLTTPGQPIEAGFDVFATTCVYLAIGHRSLLTVANSHPTSGGSNTVQT